MEKRKYSFLYRNGLSIAFLILMLFSFAGQIYTGWKEHNDFLADYKVSPLSLEAYLVNGHFLQATFENWESEFFQMALFVIFTIFLRQKGSSESKACEEALCDPDELTPKPDSPWAVKKGGMYLAFYKHSLSIALFFSSFVPFAYTGMAAGLTLMKGRCWSINLYIPSLHFLRIKSFGLNPFKTGKVNSSLFLRLYSFPSI